MAVSAYKLIFLAAYCRDVLYIAVDKQEYGAYIHAANVIHDHIFTTALKHGCVSGDCATENIVCTACLGDRVYV